MRILVVEDDARLAAVLRNGLNEQGFAVEVAGEAQAGLALALATAFDAVLLDVNLPGADGFEVVRQLRAHGDAVPILVLTARSSVEDRVKGLDLGADDYLSKPFDFKELLARLRAITRRPSIEPSAVLRVADLELNPTTKEVRRGRRKIELTAKEFALLEYLMRKKGVVVTRGMILDHVWDLNYHGASNLVEVYINYLRRKVDQDFDPKVIHTLRGFGYVLRDTE